MLNSETKRHIDAARDVLVGVAPNPTTQIDQITYALIYKFMDDMDKEAVELGGLAKFFSDYKVPDPEFPNDRKKDKVIEFSKDAKKIVVSHTRTFEEGEDKPAAAAKGGKKSAGSATDQAVKAINQSSEKSTLGDLDALSALKEKMEKGE